MNKTYYKELAHMILEANKSHGVSSDPRAENQFQLTSGRQQFLRFSVFYFVVVVVVLLRPSMDQMRPTHIVGRGGPALLSLPIHMPTLFGNTLTEMGFSDSLAGKESTCNAGDPGLIPGSGRSAGEGIGYPLQYS